MFVKACVASILLVSIIYGIYAVSTPTFHVSRLLSANGIDVRDGIVTVALLNDTSSELGNSGHSTYLVSLTPKGYQSLVDQMKTCSTSGDATAMPRFSEFGNTLSFDKANHSIHTIRDRQHLIILCDDFSCSANIITWW